MTGTAPSTRPELVVFDVNETLSDLSPMGQRFADVGAPAHLARLWFASVLRDGFALTAAGGDAVFSDLAEELLRSCLHGCHLTRDLEAAVQHVMSGFASLGVHPDVPDGISALHDTGLRLVTLSNGSASVGERLLTDAGLRDRFEQLLSVETPGVWKPAAAAYGYALDACGVAGDAALLVAVHPWDVDGAKRAGLRAAWLNRTGAPYPSYFRAPDVEIASLPELAGRLSTPAPG